MDPILYDSHMHTPLCKHAKGEPEAYARRAEQQRLKGIIITCHNPGPKGWGERVRMSLEQFPTYLEMVERARRAWNGRVDVRLGLESDYYPGFEPFLTDLHQSADFQYILGSVHPGHPYYKKMFSHRDKKAYQQLYFEHLAMAAESGLFDCLSHPDLIKALYLHDWHIKDHLDHIESCLDRIAETGVAMELNTSGLRKPFKEVYPGFEILKAMQTRDIPVVLGSDAHAPERVGSDFLFAIDCLEMAGYTHVTHFIDRQPHQIDLKSAHDSLLPIKRELI